jgi:hypothetical protein
MIRPGHATQFSDAWLLLIIPVMDREDRHRSVHAVVSQWQRCGGPTQRRHTVGGSLSGHDIARLDRDDVPI